MCKVSFSIYFVVLYHHIMYNVLIMSCFIRRLVCNFVAVVLYGRGGRGAGLCPIREGRAACVLRVGGGLFYHEVDFTDFICNLQVQGIISW